MPAPDDLAARLAALETEVAALRAEAEIRQLIGRYMFLCDAPLAEPAMADAERAQAIADLYTEDGVWEGVGSNHGNAFGRQNGHGEIRAFFLDFYAREPRLVFNTHYLCSEQIAVTGGEAEGRWVQFQPWIHADGASLVRSSRLRVRFRRTHEGWRIAHYRTENLFIAPLAPQWTSFRIERSVLMGAP